MKTVQCQCGGYIRAQSAFTGGREAVAIHNMTLPHLAWRQRMGIYTPGLFGAKSSDPRRRWPTADDDSCDVSGNTDGASTTGVEGTA
jgi:hypothetical protein